MKDVIEADDSRNLLADEFGVCEAADKEHSVDVMFPGGMTDLHGHVLQNIPEQAASKILLLPVTCTANYHQYRTMQVKVKGVIYSPDIPEGSADFT